MISLYHLKTSQLLFSESFVKYPPGDREIEVAHEFAGLDSPELAIHSGIFPLHGERALITDRIEFADNILEIDLPPSETAEIPAPARLVEIEVAGQNARAAIQGDNGIFPVHVEDSVRKLPDPFPASAGDSGRN